MTMPEEMQMASEDRVTRVFDLSYECLRRKINGGRIKVENEASLQLHFAAILKSVGELLEVEAREQFRIELEKPVIFAGLSFIKSASERAKIDIYFEYFNPGNGTRHSGAVEVKFFRKKNHREPNNRYDVFADLHNLENYGRVARQCFMVVVTDHDHYVRWPEYSRDTCDFDFRHERRYAAGTVVTYRTPKPYGAPITLRNSYDFAWDQSAGGLHFLKIPVAPHETRLAR
jgi:hypothetical protein